MFQKIIKSRIFTFLIILLVFWLGLSILKVYNQKKEVDAEVRDLETKAGEIEKSNAYIEKLLAYINIPEFLEREARIRLNYMSADEKMVYVYKDTNVLKSPVQALDEKINKDNIFIRFWRWLRNK